MSFNKKQFKNNIKTYVQCEKELDKLNKKIKEIRQLKESVTPIITKFMEKNKLDELSINNNYKIVLNKSNSFQGVSKTFIKERLTQYLKNSHHGEKITDYIYNSRDKKERKWLAFKHIDKN